MDPSGVFHFGHNGYSVMADSGVDPIVSTHPRLLTNNEYRAGGPNLINLMEPQSLPYQSRSCTRSTKLHFSDQKLMIPKSGIIGCNEYDHTSEEYKKLTVPLNIFSISSSFIDDALGGGKNV